MPTKSVSQRRLMQAAAHIARSSGVPQDVAREFLEADKRKKKSGKKKK